MSSPLDPLRLELCVCLFPVYANIFSQSDYQCGQVLASIASLVPEVLLSVLPSLHSSTMPKREVDADWPV